MTVNVRHYVRIACYLLATACGGVTLCRAELPTVEEVFATHRANCEKLATIHVQVTITENATQAADRQQEKEREECQLILDKIESGEITDEALGAGAKAAGITVKYLAQQTRERMKYRKLTSHDKPIINHLEIFVQGDDYQVRSPAELAGYDVTAWKFSSATVTAKSLLEQYADIRIHSRSASIDPPARVWCGADANGEPEGALQMAGHISDSQGINLPPYMQSLKPRWDYEHPIDAFYSAAPDCYRVVRQETVDGRQLTVIEGLVPHATKVSRTKDDGSIEELQRVDHLIAWIDIEHGAVPVKLERRFGQSGDSFEEAAKGTIQETLTSTKVVELPNGAYYPAATLQEMYEGSIAPGELARWDVHRRRLWNCSLVEAAVPFVDSFFVLSFPAGQTFYDLDAKKVIGGVEYAEPLKLGDMAPPLQVARWLDGKERTLEDFRGRVVFIEFWGLWCSACRNGVDGLKQLQSHYQGKPVTFIAIHTANADVAALQQRIEKYVGDEDWQFIHAIDAGTMLQNSITSHAYGVDSFPGEFVLDEEGRVAFSDMIPAPEMADIVGKSCDELTEEEQKRAEEYARKLYAEAGVEYPDSKDEEAVTPTMLANSNRVKAHFLRKEIDSALKREPAQEPNNE